MCLNRHERFPHFAPLDGWASGPVIVTVFSDRDFLIEQTMWDGERLRWRDKSWKA